MARIAVTCTVIFLLFAFSHARSPLDLPENDVESHDPSITLPESDTKTTTILLPSEKPETEPNTVVELEPEIMDTTPLELETISAEPIQDLPRSEPESVDGLGLKQPFTIVTFRPTNLHFPQIRGDRQSPFRFPHRCRHHHRHHFGGVGPRFNGEGPEISYGNDMIIPKEDINTDPKFHNDELHKIPARWVRFHHHHGRPMFPFKHERWNKEEMKRPFHHMEEDEVAEEHREGGLMKRIRKFLNHF